MMLLPLNSKAIFYLTLIVPFGFSSRNIKESWEKTHCIPWSQPFKLVMFNKVWTETNSEYWKVWQRMCCMRKPRLSFLAPLSLTGHFCAYLPPFDYLVMIIEVCGLKSNIWYPSLLNTERKESLISLTENLLLVLYRL